MNKTIGGIMLLAALTLGTGASAQKIVDPEISYAGTPRTCVIGGIAVSGVEGYEDYMLTDISGLSVGQKIQVPTILLKTVTSVGLPANRFQPMMAPTMA